MALCCWPFSRPAHGGGDATVSTTPPPASPAVFSRLLAPDSFRHYIEAFNAEDEELYAQEIPNTNAWAFLSANMPWFECPDREFERTYYFRWWTFRKHIKRTDDGFVITEFLPAVPWAGKHNAISCPAGHHFYEGRWLKDPRYLDDYSFYWFRKGGSPRTYSFWAADAIWARHLVHPNPNLLTNLLPDLITNFEAWQKSHFDAHAGLYWQNDGNDGMEVSIGGSGYRVTLNSYQYGDAQALARMASLSGRADLVTRFETEAARIKRAVEQRLWDEPAQFFKVAPRAKPGEALRLADVRELHGFTPWYVGLPDPRYAVAWRQFADPEGFRAPYGLTTAEQRHPKFALAYEGHECQWNGPSWPLATSITLTALARVLEEVPDAPVTRQDYFEALRTYALSHRLRREDGRVVPWIDENLHPRTGDWIARTLLRQRNQAPRERGKDYNHSSFCDLVISGLVGLRPRADELVTVRPLVPAATWDWFCLDQVSYRGRQLAVLWDRTGARYGRGPGLQVFADGQRIASSPTLDPVQGKLPSRAPASSSTDLARVPGVVINHSPASSGLYIGSPSLAVLPSGAYLASHDFFGPRSEEHSRPNVAVFRSEDGGVSWRPRASIRGLFWANLFVHRGAAYIMGTDKHHGRIVIRRSLDGGATWTEPRDGSSGLLTTEGQYHTAPMPVVEHAGRLWRAFENASGGTEWGRRYLAGMLSVPSDADLLDSTNWVFSRFLARDPAWLDNQFNAWLEGNAIRTWDGRIVNLMRVDTPGFPEKAALIEVDATGKSLRFDPSTGFIDFPGGAKKFTVRPDPRGEYYWSLATVVHESYRQRGKPAGTRNTLALVRSRDLRRWETRCVLLHHPDAVKHGFQYVDWHFEGEDLIAVCRTAFEDGLGGAHNNHDANYLTFHRWPRFRQLGPEDSVLRAFDSP